MANRRMFAKSVVETDDFLDMGATARLLYYDLGMQADDDGFVQPKRVMRATGASADDLHVLTAKGFLIPCDDRVLVIRDWKINNQLRPDRYTPTVFIEHKTMLSLNEGKRYVFGATDGGTAGRHSIEESSIKEDITEENSASPAMLKVLNETKEMLLQTLSSKTK